MSQAAREDCLDSMDDQCSYQLFYHKKTSQFFQSLNHKLMLGDLLHIQHALLAQLDFQPNSNNLSQFDCNLDSDH